MTTSEIIVLSIVFVIWLLWIGYIQRNHDYEMGKVKIVMDEADERTDKYLEDLDGFINKARAGRCSESESANS